MTALLGIHPYLQPFNSSCFGSSEPDNLHRDALSCNSAAACSCLVLVSPSHSPVLCQGLGGVIAKQLSSFWNDHENFILLCFISLRALVMILIFQFFKQVIILLSLVLECSGFHQVSDSRKWKRWIQKFISQLLPAGPYCKSKITLLLDFWTVSLFDVALAKIWQLLKHV